MDTWLGFTCPAHYCELLYENLEESAAFLKDLINQGLDSYPRKTFIDEIKLNFSAFENTYIVEVHLQCYLYLGVMVTDWVKMESIISHMLLQCFWEVHSLEY